MQDEWRVSGLDDEDYNDEEQVEMTVASNCAASWDRCEFKVLRARGLGADSTTGICCRVCVNDEELGRSQKGSLVEDVWIWSEPEKYEISFDKKTEINIFIQENKNEEEKDSSSLMISFKPYEVREARRSSGNWNPNAWYNVIDCAEKEMEAALQLQSIYVDEVPNSKCDQCLNDKSMIIFNDMIEKKFRSTRKPKSIKILSFAEKKSILEKNDLKDQTKIDQINKNIVSPITSPIANGIDRLEKFVWGAPETGTDEIYALILASTRMPVFLHVYDLGTSTLIGGLNRTIQGPLSAGIFHTGIEIGGREYAFGGCRTQGKSGIFSCRPRHCPLHTYRESIYLGDAGLSESHIKAIVDDLKPRFLGTNYDLLRFNCCTFSREFSFDLGLGNIIPSWIDRLALVAASIAGNAVVSPSASSEQQRNYGTLRLSDDLSEYELTYDQVQDSRESLDLDRVLVEHAMATKMQRIIRKHTLEHHSRFHTPNSLIENEDPRGLAV
uniref:PPPDE domain-containing protein n=1 Tax=Aureoumbra lagunensis TaxID=44058 RepID=A0A7S3NFF5_9STRA